MRPFQNKYFPGAVQPGKEVLPHVMLKGSGCQGAVVVALCHIHESKR